MDQLSLLLGHLALRAGVFYTGQVCGAHRFDDEAPHGHLHLVKCGPVRVVGAGPETVIDQPSLVFLPRPAAHRLIADARHGAELVCASVTLGGGGSNPIADSLPPMVLVALDDLSGARVLLDLLFDEAFADRCGRQAALDRLCEVLVIRLLRHCIDRGITRGGMLAGLSDPRLSKALSAIHADPSRHWELAQMAAAAGMSRARFAARFREVTGATPADYLAAWRITTAQGLLRAGRRLKQVACDVGYGSAGAFTRAFVRKVGRPPTEWLRQAEGVTGGRAARPH